MSIFTLASRVTGLVRELLIASMFGASALTDAFNVAFRIPNLFRRLFAEGAFSQAFVPVLAASRAQHGDQATQEVIDSVATALAWSVLALSILGVLVSPGLVWLMASGLQQDARGYGAAVNMTRWMFPYIAFMSMVALSAGILNTWKRFAVPAVTRDKEYDVTQGNKSSKVLYFSANPNGEAEIVSVQLTLGSLARVKKFEFDFSTLEIKGRTSKGNTLTKYPVKNVKLKVAGKSTLGGKELWFDDVFGRLNTEEKGTIKKNSHSSKGSSRKN